MKLLSDPQMLHLMIDTRENFRNAARMIRLKDELRGDQAMSLADQFIYCSTFQASNPRDSILVS